MNVATKPAGLDASGGVSGRLLILSRSVASVAWKWGCSVDHAWGSSSFIIASRWSSMLPISRMVAVIFFTSSTGAFRARPAISRAVGSSSSSGTQRQTRPTFSAASPSSTSPNTTDGERRLGAGDALEHPGVAAAGVDAEVQEAGVEAGRRTGQSEVADERQVHAGADGGTVDGGDRGQRAATDPHEALVDGEQALLRPLLAQVAQIRARAERRRRAGDDHGTDRRVGLDRVEGGEQLLVEVQVERVAPLGVVEGDGGDAVGQLGEHASHGRHPSEGAARDAGARSARSRAGPVDGPSAVLAYPAGMGASEVQVTLDAVIVAVTDETPRVLAVLDPGAEPGGAGPGGGRAGSGAAIGVGAHAVRLPSGLLDADDRTLERAACAAWCASRPASSSATSSSSTPSATSTARHARPARAEPSDGRGCPRQLSIAYLALVRESRPSAGAAWLDWYDLYPWEDHRAGRPEVLDATIVAGAARLDRRRPRRRRSGPPAASGPTIVFGLGGGGWDGVRVLERYELLYELGPAGRVARAPPRGLAARSRRRGGGG